jgi:Fur family ferric uptake transcriptional regulator
MENPSRHITQRASKQHYTTKQGKAIEAYLAQTGGAHVTVDDVAAHFAKTGAPIGRSTIYRQLEKLVEAGSVRRFEAGAGQSACYQFSPGDASDPCDSHFHLKCELCGKLIHQDCSELAVIQKHIKDEHGFNIDPLRTVFYGICADCASKAEAAGDKQ